MRESLRLADATIVAALRAHYGLAVKALTFLPLGNDAASAVYRVDAADGASYFLKARAVDWFSAASLAVPHYLHDQGVPHLVAPLLTITETLWVMVNDFALSLYPFIEGRAGAEVGLSGQHWRMLGATVKEIHASQLTADLRPIVPRETFTPIRRSVIEDLEAAFSRPASGDPVKRELAVFWHSRRDEIRALMDRAETLGRRLRELSAPLVLCHADLHTWNVLLDAAQQLWLVDWDETILAPKELDLMFMIGGIGRRLVGPRETECFLQGYGEPAIDQSALVYYRYARALQDIRAYGDRIFFLPDLGEKSRRDAVRGFMSLFEPGSIVELAVTSDVAV